MSERQYWSFGLAEAISTLSGGVLLSLFSLVLRIAPPWWFLPIPLRYETQRHLDLNTWQLYAEQGGYAAFWLQSLVGWAIVGAILGLIFSNMALRGRPWND